MPHRQTIVALIITDAPLDEVRAAVDAIVPGLRVVPLEGIAHSRGFSVLGDSANADLAEPLRAALNASHPGSVVHSGSEGYEMTPPPK